METETAIVLEQTLKIVMEGENEVQPIVDIRRTVNHATGLFIDNRKEFSVKMTRGGLPVVGHKFELTKIHVLGSGGHDHSNTLNRKRVKNFENYGHFRPVFNSTIQKNPFIEKTKISGIFNVYYIASIWGDHASFP